MYLWGQNRKITHTFSPFSLSALRKRLTIFIRFVSKLNTVTPSIDVGMYGWLFIVADLFLEKSYIIGDNKYVNQRPSVSLCVSSISLIIWMGVNFEKNLFRRIWFRDVLKVHLLPRRLVLWGEMANTVSPKYFIMMFPPIREKSSSYSILSAGQIKVRLIHLMFVISCLLKYLFRKLCSLWNVHSLTAFTFLYSENVFEILKWRTTLSEWSLGEWWCWRVITCLKIKGLRQAENICTFS
jgi:hypothetical protein